MKKSILLTGGAGYIGSHTCYQLIEYLKKNNLEEDYDVIIIDNFINCDFSNVEAIQNEFKIQLKIYYQDLCDYHKLYNTFSENNIIAVIHFAGLKAVGESSEKPLLYYENNLQSTFNLLKIMEEFKCYNIIFSSSATVYGTPKENPIKENFSCSPFNPYGRTKYFIEELLKDLHLSKSDLNIIILRYFNPISCHPNGLLKENPKGRPNNLFPIISRVYQKIIPELSVYGDDYKDTHDGTGVRDYIHVVDLAEAHVLSLFDLIKNENRKNYLNIYNVGTGRGFSVMEMIKMFEKISEEKINYKIVERRPGDIGIYYGDPSKIINELKWYPKYNLEDMVKHEIERIKKNI